MGKQRRDFASRTSINVSIAVLSGHFSGLKLSLASHTIAQTQPTQKILLLDPIRCEQKWLELEHTAAIFLVDFKPPFS